MTFDNTLAEQFDKLYDYTNKLIFWDENGLGFKNTRYLTPNGGMYTILPTTPTELAE
jgi:hypothetical protein